MKDPAHSTPDDARVDVSWCYPPGGYANYSLRIKVEGEAGTDPTCLQRDASGTCLR